jgi:hypothetical protein
VAAYLAWVVSYNLRLRRATQGLRGSGEAAEG